MADVPGYRPFPANLGQGDIFRNVPFVKVNTVTPAIEHLFELGPLEVSNSSVELPGKRETVIGIRLGLGVLLNNGCDIDKPYTSHLLVAPVMRLDQLNAERQVLVRQNRFLRCFYLPELPEVFPNVQLISERLPRWRRG